MAEAELTEDSPVPSRLLNSLASRTYMQSLREFATTLLGIDDTQCENVLYQARQDGSDFWLVNSKVDYNNSFCLSVSVWVAASETCDVFSSFYSIWIPKYYWHIDNYEYTKI